MKNEIRLAHSLVHAERWVEAWAVINKLLNEDPERPEILYLAGCACRGLGHIGMGLPLLAKALQDTGRQLTQATGNRFGWLVGAELTQELHRSRLTIDLPRDEWFTTNPHAVPCTYTGPRVHIAAACGVPCLCINPRGDLAVTYPKAPTSTLEDGIGEVLRLLEHPDELQAIADANLEQFQLVHAPAIRARQLIDLVERHCLSERGIG